MPLVDVCHCAMCRRWGGAFFGGIGAAGFTVTGREHIATYRSSKWAQRCFCSVCGSNLWFEFLPTGRISFLAGLFDLSPEVETRFAIEQQIFVDEKPAWYDLAQRTPVKTGAEAIAEAKAAGFELD